MSLILGVCLIASVFARNRSICLLNCIGIKGKVFNAMPDLQWNQMKDGETVGSGKCCFLLRKVKVRAANFLLQKFYVSLVFCLLACL
jgi:hypothetical protein